MVQVRLSSDESASLEHSVFQLILRDSDLPV